MAAIKGEIGNLHELRLARLRLDYSLELNSLRSKVAVKQREASNKFIISALLRAQLTMEPRKDAQR